MGGPATTNVTVEATEASVTVEQPDTVETTDDTTDEDTSAE